MNDKELADAAIDLGAGTCRASGYYRVDMDDLDCEDFVRDWRVAGALLERLGSNSYHIAKMPGDWSVTQQGYGRLRNYESESLPRAIIEACVAALSTVADKQEE